MAENTALLRVRNLNIVTSAQGHWHDIIRDVSFDLRRGEVLGLVGESGAGKSTLGLAALGFFRDGCRLNGGQIIFDGRDLAHDSEHERRIIRGRRMAYVAQSAAASFNPAHRLITQYSEAPLQQGLMSRAQAQRDAIELYNQMRLPHPEQIGFRYPHQLSGGQLQRAMTAMAMACRPDLIVFDEPTTALDVTTQIEVLRTIRRLIEQFETAALYITHDLAVVAQMADHIMVLQQGRPVESAPTAQILDNPAEDYTKSLWAVRRLARPHTADVKPGTTPLLSLQNLDAHYGKFQALSGLSLDVHAGRTLAIVGESGSGKSTAARAITGLLPPSSGQILFHGNALPPRLEQRSRDQLRHIQMIYQSPDTALNPRQSVRTIIGRPVEFYLGLKGQDKEKRIRELLTQIELPPDDYLERRPPELSGGQKQRIGIARALAVEPDFIICDEVTSALDQLVAGDILKLLMKLQQDRGLGYLFITHDLAIVRAIADDVVVMQQGKVVEAGTRNDIFTPPHKDYTEILLSSVPEMDPDWLTRTLNKSV